MAAKIGLVLEGGGMRGLYTCGVLDRLHESHWYPDFCIGVSAGACNAASYLSDQYGRARRVIVDNIENPRYLGMRNYLKTGSMFGMDFIFKEIPEKLDPFDYAAFGRNPVEFLVGVTDVETGLPAYYGKEAMRRGTTLLRASSSLPVFSPIVNFRGHKYLDGGTSDPIPVRKAIEAGCDRLIVVLTRPAGYRKQPESGRAVYRYLYRRYPAMIDCIERRHIVYNDELDYVAELEAAGTALVLRPPAEIPIGRFEKRRAVLDALYEAGHRDAGPVIGWAEGR